MRAVAIILILGVFISQDGANWLAEGTRFSPAAMFYMLQGAWVATLSACFLILLSAAKSSIWKRIAIGALVISIIESVQVVACRFAVSDIKTVPAGKNLCDVVTGFPIGATVLTLEVLALLLILGSMESDA